MLPLPTQIIAVLMPFAPLFSQPVFRHVQVLLVGAILTPGRRTVANALPVMGLADIPQLSAVWFLRLCARRRRLPVQEPAARTAPPGIVSCQIRASHGG